MSTFNFKEPRRYLLDDITLNCLARVPRSEYPKLSLVSKSYHSLIASSCLYDIRSMMGRTETNVYLCLRTPDEPQNPRWCILRRHREEFSMIPIPSLPSQPPEESSVVVLDWGIYLIGGLINRNPTSSAWVLDCRTHTWRRLPSMKVARANAAVGVVDGKIYVYGGHKINIGKSFSWGEVFDPKTQTWHNFEKNQNLEDDSWPICNSVVVDKKVYAMDGTCQYINYSPSENKWRRSYLIELSDLTNFCIGDWCVIDNISYCLDSLGIIYWFKPDELNRVEPDIINSIKEVKGLESLSQYLSNSKLIHFNEEDVASWEQRRMNQQVFNIAYVDLFTRARMSSSGGNILLFWDVIIRDHIEIWCTEISLERRKKDEIWGNILWSNVVMSVDRFNRYKILYSVSVTL